MDRVANFGAAWPVLWPLTGLVLDRTGRFYWAFVIMSLVALPGTASWMFIVGVVEQVAWQKKPKVAASSD
jgi:hypothetical protein